MNKADRSLVMDIGATLLIVVDVFGQLGGSLGALAIFILLWNIRLNGGKLQYLHATPVLLNSLKAHQGGEAGKLAMTPQESEVKDEV